MFYPCGSHCPANVLLLQSSPGLGHTLEVLFRVSATDLLLATASLLALRLRRATRVMRHILAPVLLASILRTVAAAAMLGVGSRHPP